MLHPYMCLMPTPSISAGQNTTQAAASGFRLHLTRYGVSALLTLLASFVGMLAHRGLEPTNLVMLYLAVVMTVAAFYGRGPAIFTSMISVLAFDMLFVPPQFSLTVHDPEYLITFVGLLGVGLIISELTARTRRQTLQALEREKNALALYRLSSRLANALDLETAEQVIRGHVSELFRGECLIRIRQSKDTTADMEEMIRDVTGEMDRSAVKRAVEHNERTGWGTTLFSSARMMYIPLVTGTNTIGVLGVRFDEKAYPLNRSSIQALEILASQTALAVERIRLAEETRKMTLPVEREKLYTALLNSISHDLRTPLVAITGALSHLAGDRRALDDPVNRELIENAHEEVSRLNRVVTNWLDMTRIESGALKGTRTPCDLQEVTGVALRQMDEALADRPVTVDIPPDLPAAIDFSLLLKVLINLLDNALKYSAAGSPIDIKAAGTGPCATLSISDRGTGIPEEDLTRIFDKFYRGSHAPHVSGIGLGLPICRGIIEAYRGSIAAENRPGGGAVFRITLPLIAPENDKT